MKRTRRLDIRLQPFAEDLEGRRLLAISPTSNALSRLSRASAIESRNGPNLMVQSVAAAPTAKVSVVRTPNPIYGYDFTLVNSERAYGYDFASVGRAFATSVEVEGLDIPAGSMLELEILTGLTYWNGLGTPSFAPVRSSTEVNLNVFGQNVRVGARTDQSTAPRGGVIRTPIDIGVSDTLALRRTIDVTIGSGGTRDSFVRSGGAPGIYAFTALWSVRNADGVRDSAPVTFVFRLGGVPNAARDAAESYFEAPATRPVAIVAVKPTFVEPDGPGQPFVRVDVEYSDPVTVVGRSPQLPILFDQTQRLADLERNSPTTNVTNLRFVYTPTRQDNQAAFIRLGESIRLPSGGALRNGAGLPAILSVPTVVERLDPIVRSEQVVTISADIARSTTFRKGTTYVIAGEVHVLSGVTLTIEDGVTVLIRNGKINGRLLDTSALIFDSGSGMNARTVYFKAADASNRPVANADNGGVFFLGTYRDATKDGVSVNTTRSAGRSSFSADQIVASYLGRSDPSGTDDNDKTLDDIDAVSVLGMGQTEWRIKAVQTEFSGDDGFDVTNSSISLESLVVSYPTEDGLNVSSSIVEIKKTLSIVMSQSRAPDRELFDFEVDDGATRVVVSRRAFVDLRGYWGSPYDEVNLNSLDMPQPIRRGSESAWYEFTGALLKGVAIIYSQTAD